MLNFFNKPVADRHLFILEFNLSSLSGHYFNQLLGFKYAAAEYGIKPYILLNQDADPVLAEQLDAFRVISWQPVDINLLDYQFDIFAAGDKQLQPVWEKLEELQISSQDMLLVLSENPVFIYSLGAWFGRIAAVARPTVFMRFVSAANYLDLKTLDYHEQSWMYRFAGQDLALRPGQEKVFFLANNHRALTDLGRLCSRRIFYMPLPKYYGDAFPAHRLNITAPVVYIHLNIRAGALIAEIVSVITAILANWNNIKFKLKTCIALNRGVTEQLNPYLQENLLEWLPEQQSHEEYMQAIAQSDIMILPYQAQEYQIHHSGVFAEGAALGKVMIYPAETWMAEQVAAGHAAGVSFAAAGQDDIRSTLLTVLTQLPTLAEQAYHRAERFRTEHSCQRNLYLMTDYARHEQDMRLVYVLGNVIHFNKRATSRGYMAEGWGETETGGVWTVSSAAKLRLNLGQKPETALLLQLLYTPFVYGDIQQGVMISINGHDLQDWDYFTSMQTYPLRLSYRLPIKPI
ncbi:hypothetical protein KEF85_01625 [Methylomonas paludis]|uniref:Glycosyl transferase n=1 Tax=Methylomonas paludis TaxID=1173101 RepID=A0A975R9M4_9GAMM|nr:hypothetical protein [Methylomonas paludis]QWF71222.1 hypothetical protein KEF85_01625 [Methylomonas paludis]